jgi:hypothetical protein
MLTSSCSPCRQTTVVSLSPDDSFRVHLMEISSGGSIDRNFRVDLEDMNKTTISTIFLSPDEGKPAGSERFIWSEDGKAFLLVGRHFFVAEPMKLTTGEEPYLFYHIPSRRGWCNSSQQGKYPSLSKSMLSAFTFKEKLVFSD